MSLAFLHFFFFIGKISVCGWLYWLYKAVKFVNRAYDFRFPGICESLKTIKEFPNHDLYRKKYYHKLNLDYLPVAHASVTFASMRRYCRKKTYRCIDGIKLLYLKLNIPSEC